MSEEAHRQHLRVAAHIYYLADAAALVKLGVDVIAHSIRDKDVDSGGLMLAMRHRFACKVLASIWNWN